MSIVSLSSRRRISRIQGALAVKNEKQDASTVRFRYTAKSCLVAAERSRGETDLLRPGGGTNKSCRIVILSSIARTSSKFQGHLFP